MMSLERLIPKLRLCPLSTGITSPARAPQITDEASSIIKRDIEAEKWRERETKVEQMEPGEGLPAEEGQGGAPH